MKQKRRDAWEIEQAAARVEQVLQPPCQTQQLPLEQARGRVLACDLTAQISQPPFTRSPLDGYALRAEDIKGADRKQPVVLPVSQYLCAGQFPQKQLQPGTAARVMTGAPIPAGADCVLRQEDTDEGRETVQIYKALSAGANVCWAGEDLVDGQLLIQHGTRLDCVHLGLLAGQGIQQVSVWPCPQVAVLPTGDELTAPGSELKPGKIYDSNGMMLSARLEELGAEPVLLKSVADAPGALGQLLAELLEQYPLVITTGGVSVGDKDYLPVAVQRAGAHLLFHGLNAKPGSPALAAEKKGHVLLALSGNPFAAFATFELLGRPAVAKMSGLSAWSLLRSQAILADEFKKASPVRRFVRARLENGLVHIPRQGHSSGGIMALAGCNCLVDIPAGSDPLQPGDKVRVILL